MIAKFEAYGKTPDESFDIQLLKGSKGWRVVVEDRPWLNSGSLTEDEAREAFAMAHAFAEKEWGASDIEWSE